MKIHCVVLNEEQRRQAQKNGWIPEKLDFMPEKCVCFGGVTEEKKLAALAVYSGHRAKAGEIDLLYLFVNRQWRESGVGMQLLKQSEELLLKRGIRKIRSEWQGSLEQLAYVSRYLERAGYIATMKPSHLLVCRQGYFQNGALEKLKKAQPRQWQSVVEIKDYYDHRLRKFLASRNTTGFYIAEDEFEPELCRFYIEEDEIRGALCMRYRSDGNLTTMKGYISPNIQYKYAMTMLIAVLIHNVKTVIKPGISIYVKIYRDGFYESAKKLFGDAQEEIFFQEYERDPAAGMAGYDRNS